MGPQLRPLCHSILTYYPSFLGIINIENECNIASYRLMPTKSNAVSYNTDFSRRFYKQFIDGYLLFLDWLHWITIFSQKIISLFICVIVYSELLFVHPPLHLPLFPFICHFVHCHLYSLPSFLHCSSFIHSLFQASPFCLRTMFAAVVAIWKCNYHLKD